MNFFYVFFVGLVLNSSVVFSGFVKVTGILGGECEYDEDCTTTNSFCKGNRVCSCKRGYEYDHGSDTCYPTEIGLKCTEDYDCSVLENSVCDRNLCQCKPGFVVTEEKKACLPLSRITFSCQENVQCSSTTHSFCDTNTNQCVCEQGYHQALDNHECLPNTGINGICNFTRECFLDEDHMGRLECEYEGQIKKCRCAHPYYLKNNQCLRGGAERLVFSFTSFFTLILVKYLL